MEDTINARYKSIEDRLQVRLPWVCNVCEGMHNPKSCLTAD